MEWLQQQLKSEACSTKLFYLGLLDLFDLQDMLVKSPLLVFLNSLSVGDLIHVAFGFEEKRLPLLADELGEVSQQRMRPFSYLLVGGVGS